MSNYTLLSAPVMRTISSHWLDNPEARTVLETHAKTASILPDIQESHQTLVDALGTEDTSEIEAQITKLRQDSLTLMALHDRKLRGVWKVLDGLIELADNQDSATALEALRTRLIPRGLSQVNGTLAEKAGQAATTRDMIEQNDHQVLQQITSTEGRTLDDDVLAWLGAGEQLGPLVTKKAALEHQLAHPEEAGNALAIQNARMAWIRTVRALEGNLDLIKDLPGADRALLLGLLEQASTNASRNRKPTITSDAPPVTAPVPPASVPSASPPAVVAPSRA